MVAGAVQDSREQQPQASTLIGKEGEIVIAGTIKRHSLASGGKMTAWIP
jgi:hypothetical protein